MAEPDAADARTRLREAALGLFGRQGVRDTSTREILTAAGMRNPSAISYHFGSKAGLVEDVVRELFGGQTSVLQGQIELANGPGPADVRTWTDIAVGPASELISTERGCLLARIWWEYDGYVHPDVFEEYLASGNPITVRWVDAVATTFTDLPHYIALVRNITMLRTLEWMIARRAGRLVIGRPTPALQIERPEAFRQLMFEVAFAILTAPTALTADDIAFRE
jgi:TetR/AcrR family transcriptional regulator, regulator of cefoperazone and chloramphenicol sensitivity